jgi:hypothetical protein
MRRQRNRTDRALIDKSLRQQKEPALSHLGLDGPIFLDSIKPLYVEIEAERRD